MKLVPVRKIEPGMRLAQNLFRHDGLLSLPKEIYIRGREEGLINTLGIKWVLVYASQERKEIKDDIHVVLNILEESFGKTTLWNKKEGEKIYVELEKMIMDNKKVQKYLLEMKRMDAYSFVQSVNVSILVCALLKEPKEIDKNLCYIAYLVLLHDVGKLKIKELINKEGKLDEGEYKKLIRHPKYSFDLLKKAGFKKDDLYFVLEHHEKYDGTGYPLCLNGEQISSLAQLVSIADVYNALSSYRPYRKSYTPYEVVKMIEKEKGKSFSPKYIQIFVERFVPYPIGCRIELNDGNIAEVTGYRSVYKTLPIIHAISKITGESIGVVDLSLEPNYRITRITEI